LMRSRTRTDAPTMATMATMPATSVSINFTYKMIKTFCQGNVLWRHPGFPRSPLESPAEKPGCSGGHAIVRAPGRTGVRDWRPGGSSSSQR
jgi:hypothetical protein